MHDITPLWHYPAVYVWNVLLYICLHFWYFHMILKLNQPNIRCGLLYICSHFWYFHMILKLNQPNIRCVLLYICLHFWYFHMILKLNQPNIRCVFSRTHFPVKPRHSLLHNTLNSCFTNFTTVSIQLETHPKLKVPPSLFYWKFMIIPSSFNSYHHKHDWTRLKYDLVMLVIYLIMFQTLLVKTE